VPGDIAVSSITAAELRYGIEKSATREKNSLALEAFLLPLEILPFDVDSALVYGKIRSELERQGRPIGGMDMLIAAQAVASNLMLITHNLRESARIQNLRCATWVENS
jgi:tRNA(fMet)-specific endonuclease VapC